MKIAIDIGNTNISLGVFNKQRILGKGSFKTRKAGDEYYFEKRLTDILKRNKISCKTISGVNVASVVPEIDSALRNAVKKNLKVNAMFINYKKVKEFKLLIKSPAQVGADRLANVMGVRKYYSFPAIVIDFGTALTFDIINKEGDYEGGIIFAGMDVAYSALLSNTSKLKNTRIEKPKTIVGKDTAECLKSGFYWGYYCIMQGLLEKIRERYIYNFTVILTGGRANLYKIPPFVDISDRNLTLKGIASF